MTATITALRKRPVRLSDLDEPKPQKREVHISDLLRADARRIDWAQCHIAADRRPWMDLRFNVGRWSR